MRTQDPAYPVAKPSTSAANASDSFPESAPMSIELLPESMDETSKAEDVPKATCSASNQYADPMTRFTVH